MKQPTLIKARFAVLKRVFTSSLGFAAFAACGTAPSNHGKTETPAPNLYLTTPGLTCSGPADDGSAYYRVDGYKNEAGAYDQVVIFTGEMEGDIDTQIGDFRYFVDSTPPPPTDIVFRRDFGAEVPGSGDYGVLLWEGGFTQMATAELSRYDENIKASIAALHCTSE